MDKFTFTIDSNEQNTNECGTNLIEYVYMGYFNFSHSGPSAKISISGLNNFFGFNSFVLGVKNLTTIENCVFIVNQSCAQCSKGLTLRDGSCSGCPSNYYEMNG